MSLYGGQTVKAATQNCISQLKQLHNIPFGLSDTIIAGLTTSGTGTVAKLITAIAALGVKDIHRHYRDNIPAAIYRCQRYGTLTDADVESAATTGTFAALLARMILHDQATTLQTGADAQAYAVWAG